MRALVTDGSNRVALAVVRALGRAGVAVSVVEQERFAVGIVQQGPKMFGRQIERRNSLILHKLNEFLDRTCPTDNNRRP